MPLIDPGDRARCEELICIPGSVFQLAYGFLRGEEADRAVAMQAFIHSVSDIPATVSDAGVAITKLAWWQRELEQAQNGATQHPVVRALQASGALARLQPHSVSSFLGGIGHWLDATPAASAEEFTQQLGRLGGSELELLAGPGRTEERTAALHRVGAASRMLSLAIGLFGPHPEAGLLPPDWLAAQNLDRMAADMTPEQRSGLATQLAEYALALRETAGTDWMEQLSDEGPAEGWLVLRAALERRRLARILRRPGRLAGGTAALGSPGEVFLAWRRARWFQLRQRG